MGNLENNNASGQGFFVTSVDKTQMIPGQTQKLLSESQKPVISRRNMLSFLGLGFMGAVAVGTTNLLKHKEEVQDVISFLSERKIGDSAESYIPNNPEAMLSRESTDFIFDKLDLDKRFPDTLNKNAFNKISQRIARLANLYFKPDKSKDQKEQDSEFVSFCESFFDRLLKLSDEMEVDFVGVLLTWQVSGANTSSPMALEVDLRDERVRVGLDLGRGAIGSSITHLITTLLRKFDTPLYYPMSRLEGPVTLGIHDIETVMIARGLEALKWSMPEIWGKVADYLQKRAPEFYQRFSSYTELYALFESKSQNIAKEVGNSEETQEYLRRFQNADFLKRLLTENDRVEDYQLLRTTVFWAKVCELQAKTALSAYALKSEELEEKALKAAINHYLESSSPTSIYLDQITNPKFMSQLEQDAWNGSHIAERLLVLSRSFLEDGENVIAKDRDVAAAIVEEDLEQDLEFQLLTGVSYSRWLLQDAYNLTNNNLRKNFRFDDPNELAFYSFLATGNRESATVYQLAGTRPLHRATLPFLPPIIMLDTMREFISDVYKKFEHKDPQKDFKTFLRYMMSLFEEAFFPNLIGVYRHELNGDNNIGEFVRESEEFGAYKKIITLPHCSWMRAIEATAGYISKI